MFSRYGFFPHDVVRPRVWNELDVEPWYAQNALLYLAQPSSTDTPLDVVHPRMWEMNLRNATIRARGERAAARVYHAAAGLARRAQQTFAA